ncbi:hypothetical protein BGZ61DRAFT_167741 [Ilyonectria robusta]|uniref:uncharacterized protein n=1 Tax=Ilyonectria robusta TaxID=1079257 RepID=UPI001E8E47E9|nr:uncharacterized protein BGZ61DRAFT_167741 [Ilyonectria robusta]KAH8733903.1 hypothetical protein BGZ61DRAFT_167741 [Ilyonectria robusta]
MAQANWDPRNLLQITSNGDLQCIGRTQKGHRCSFRSSDRYAVRIQPLLELMSSIHPRNTWQMPLDRLASLCLCWTHRDEATRIADGWKMAIEAANWHHQLQSGPARLQAAYLGNEVEELRAATTYWKEQFEMNQATNRTQVLKLKESNKSLEDGIKKSSTALDVARRETLGLQFDLNEANDGLRAVSAEVDHARNDNEMLRQTINKLQEDKASLLESAKKRCIEADAAKERERQLVAELEANESYLHQCRVEIGDERSHNAALESLVGNLQNMEIKMTKSISECWLHRFWGWIARVRVFLQWQSSSLATNVWQRTAEIQVTSQFGVGLGSFLWKKPMFWYPIQQSMLYY